MDESACVLLIDATWTKPLLALWISGCTGAVKPCAAATQGYLFARQGVLVQSAKPQCLSWIARRYEEKSVPAGSKREERRKLAG